MTEEVIEWLPYSHKRQQSQKL